MAIKTASTRETSWADGTPTWSPKGGRENLQIQNKNEGKKVQVKMKRENGIAYDCAPPFHNQLEESRSLIDSRMVDMKI